MRRVLPTRRDSCSTERRESVRAPQSETASLIYRLKGNPAVPKGPVGWAERQKTHLRLNGAFPHVLRKPRSSPVELSTTAKESRDEKNAGVENARLLKLGGSVKNAGRLAA